MIRIKNLRGISALIFCLLLPACVYTSGHRGRSGRLEPIATERSKIISQYLKNDSLQINYNSVRITVRGYWGLSLRMTTVNVQIENENKTPILLDFNQCTMSDDYSEKGELFGIQENVEDGLKWVQSATINRGEKRSFTLTYVFPDAPKLRKVLGTVVELRIPIQQGLHEPADFTFKFKYAEYQFSLWNFFDAW